VTVAAKVALIGCVAMPLVVITDVMNIYMYDLVVVIG